MDQARGDTAGSEHCQDHSQSGAITKELLIEGAECASCVGKIEAALRRVPGVVSASMNFAQRTVTVTGRVKEEKLVKAIENAGYNAKSSQSSSDDELIEEKEAADLAYYKRLSRDSDSHREENYVIPQEKNLGIN